MSRGAQNSFKKFTMIIFYHFDNFDHLLTHFLYISILVSKIICMPLCPKSFLKFHFIFLWDFFSTEQGLKEYLSHFFPLLITFENILFLEREQKLWGGVKIFGNFLSQFFSILIKYVKEFATQFLFLPHFLCMDILV